MLADIGIALGLGALTAFLGYLGVHVTIHAQTDPRKIRLFKAAFVGAASITVGLIALQAYRVSRSSSALEAAIENEGEKTRDEIKKAEARPISITIPPTKRPLPTGQTKQQAETSRRAAMKFKATQLSAEMLTFLSDRNRSGLGYFRLAELMQSPKSETVEQLNQRWDAEKKRYDAFRSETMKLYGVAFDARATSLLAEMRSAGIDVSRAWYKPGDPETVEKFALDLAAIARDIQ